jgi:hypothetical protein
VRRRDFEAMVRRMVGELPEGFLEGVVAIEVTGKTVPHPVRADIYTLGECVPHDFGGPDEGAALRSTVYLYYGSFAALAKLDPAFAWREEAWETLAHEVRHHLEWRARVPELEALDAAAEANYARHDGEPFPPLFHLDGERVAPGVTKVEDDVFIEVMLDARVWKRAGGTQWPFTWHGRTYTAQLPAPLPDILFLAVTGVEPAPAGDLVLVVRRRPGARDLLHRAVVAQAGATATTAAGMVHPPSQT